MKRIALISLVIMVLLGSLINAQAAGTYKIGDTFTFGHFEQDGNEANGAEPIWWIVIDVKDDGSLVLISSLVLAFMPFHDSFNDVAWATCSLRTWLNHDFLYDAFDYKEMEKIQTNTVVTPDNPIYKTPGGGIVEDKVYLLSFNEITTEYGCDGTYCAYFSNPHKLRAFPTDFAKAALLEWWGGDEIAFAISLDETGAAIWWLRTMSIDMTCACTVPTHGIILDSSAYSNIGPQGVRPVICIKP